LKEPEIIERCKKGDRKAQRELYDAYADRMYRVVLRYLKSNPDAEDVLQVAFTKIYAGIRDFEYREPGSAESWIRRIVVNEALMWLRKRHNFHMTESLEEIHEPVDLGAFSELPGEEITKLIGQLPPGYRTVFNLYVVEGYNHAEIGGMLGVTESTSRTQLYKAKSILRKILTQEGFQYGT